MIREIQITYGPNRELVELLTASGTLFLVVGGTAARFYSPERRDPSDLDLLIEPSVETLPKLNAALAHVGAPLIIASPEVLAQPDKWYTDKRVLNVDVLTPPKDVNFREVWADAEETVMTFSSTRVRVASNQTLQSLLRFAQTREPAREQEFAEELELLERAMHRPRL